MNPILIQMYFLIQVENLTTFKETVDIVVNRSREELEDVIKKYTREMFFMLINGVIT